MVLKARTQRLDVRLMSERFRVKKKFEDEKTIRQKCLNNNPAPASVVVKLM